MKVLFLLISILFLSCGTQKNNAETIENQTKGTIVKSENCTYIEVIIEKDMLTMYPVNMSDEFKKSGLKISFDYRPSKAPQPANCKVDRVISVSNVSLIKN